MIELKHLIIFSSVILFLLLIGEILFRYFKVKTEYTRKFAHFTTGIATLWIPYFFHNHLTVLVLTILFLSVLIIGKKLNQIRSIDSVKRETIGSYLFPISIYICFLISDYYDDKSLFIIPVLILSVSDTLAALFGTFIKSKEITHRFVKDKKTIFGSLTFFVSSTLILSISMINYSDLSILKSIFYSLIIGFIGTILELISRKGFDNLTVPISVSLLLILLKTFL
jgi:phosphatidate cytidylyltransferase/phytol kinase